MDGFFCVLSFRLSLFFPAYSKFLSVVILPRFLLLFNNGIEKLFLSFSTGVVFPSFFAEDLYLAG